MVPLIAFVLGMITCAVLLTAPKLVMKKARPAMRRVRELWKILTKGKGK